ncbi:alpha-tocopherol transfer protein-like [Hyalella azteca]|uniref:Alpha-tocopherol transfer protein-like n=1 Tax=Hyalella azteca TaxID=294128 RepID=A0A8B7N955_HYAAZ|nr:alpha-tocopherol transfer protein-like [Hyalella azteca]
MTLVASPLPPTEPCHVADVLDLVQNFENTPMKVEQNESESLLRCSMGHKMHEGEEIPERSNPLEEISSLNHHHQASANCEASYPGNVNSRLLANDSSGTKLPLTVSELNVSLSESLFNVDKSSPVFLNKQTQSLSHYAYESNCNSTQNTNGEARKSCPKFSDDRREPPTATDGLLPDEYFAEAELDLHEKQEWIVRDVEALREMVLRDEGLQTRTDSAFLLTFLRARKFDYEKALIMVQGYYRSRQANRPFYTGLTVSSLQHVWEKKLQTILPSPDLQGRTVLIFRAGSWNPSTVSLDDLFKAQVLLLEHAVRNPVTQLKGIAAVVDCAGLGRTHAYNLTAAHVRRMVAIVQEVFPLRFKALHFINEPLMFEWMFSLIKPLLSDTIKKRLHFHGSNTQSLLDFIPGHELPSELGGSGPPMDNSELVELLTEQEAYFKDHFSYGYIGSARPSARSSVTRTNKRPLPRSVSVSDAGRSSRINHGGRECADEALRPTECAGNASLTGSVTDMGSILGSYYRRMCID